MTTLKITNTDEGVLIEQVGGKGKSEDGETDGFVRRGGTAYVSGKGESLQSAEETEGATEN